MKRTEAALKEMRRLWWSQPRRRLADIAGELGISYPTLCAWRRDLGLPRRPRGPIVNLRTGVLLKKYAGKMLDREVAARAGISISYVTLYRTIHHIPPFMRQRTWLRREKMKQQALRWRKRGWTFARIAKEWNVSRQYVEGIVKDRYSRKTG